MREEEEAAMVMQISNFTRVTLLTTESCLLTPLNLESTI